MDGHVQHDGFGRDINYLRIAVTDKCNFRCIYCMPADGVAPRAHDELLSAEEIAHFVRLVAGEGIRRVRLTGGEPLVSRRIIPLIRDIRAIPQIEDISLTTNGALLPKLASQLKDAGLNRVNISLDTLDPVLFEEITRLGWLEQTMAGIDASLAWGFEPVKVNCVVVRRLNQDVAALARLTVDRPIHLLHRIHAHRRRAYELALRREPSCAHAQSGAVGCERHRAERRATGARQCRGCHGGPGRARTARHHRRSCRHGSRALLALSGCGGNGRLYQRHV